MPFGSAADQPIAATERAQKTSREMTTPRRSRGAIPTPSSSAMSVLIDQIVFQNSHLELERAIVVLVIDEQHADEFLANIDLGGIVLLGTRNHADFGVAEYTLEVGVEFPDFLNVHGSLRMRRHLWGI